MKIKAHCVRRACLHGGWVALVLFIVGPLLSPSLHAAPVTLQTVWHVADGQTPLLAQLTTPGGEPVLWLEWAQSNAAGGFTFFTTWSLALHAQDATGHIHTTTLGSLPAPRVGQQVDVVLSVHPEANVAAVRLTDITAANVLYQGATALPELAGPLQSGADVSHGFQPVADRVLMGETTPGGMLFASRAVTHDTLAAIRLQTAARLPGEYTAVMHPIRSPEAAVDMGPIVWDDKGEGRWTFHTSDVPLGELDVTVTYTEGTHTTVVHTQQMTVGMLDVRTTLEQFNYDEGLIHGRLWATAAAPLPGVTVHINAGFTQASDAVHVPVMTVPATDLMRPDGVPFVAAMPSGEGVWELELSAQTEPELLVRSASNREHFARYPRDTGAPAVDADVIARLRPGYEDVIDNWQSAQPYVAVTDQGTRRILIMDPDVEDWNAPEAIKWSWYPNATNGFAGTYFVWDKPDEVKLRLNDEGAWLLVTDSSGLAAMVPFPDASSRKWSLMVGGSPHSAELLPDGNIVVAASQGHWVRIYTSSQGPNSTHYTQHTLEGAHGVLWDPERQLLWALGTYELHALRVGGTPSQPTLQLVQTTRLPTNGGHDLAPVYGNTDRLWITTSSRVYQYVKSTDSFDTTYAGAEYVSSMGAVKGIGNQHSGRIVLTKADGTLYAHATKTVHLFGPRETRVMDGAAFYKARVLHPDYQ